MKKVILAAVIAVTGLTLFSFRGVKDAEKFDITQLRSLEHQTKSFVKSCRVFSDKFVAWRETHTSKIQDYTKKEQATLNKF